MKLSRFTRSQIAASHGGAQLHHIPGMNPRKYSLTDTVHGAQHRGRVSMGMSHVTAPYKHEMQHFGGGIGIEGPEEGLPP